MKTLPLIMLLGLMGSPPFVCADAGDTMDQAMLKYGSPSGQFELGAKTLLIYDIAEGRITETYDEKGVCIESNAPQILPRSFADGAEGMLAATAGEAAETEPAPEAPNALASTLPVEREVMVPVSVDGLDTPHPTAAAPSVGASEAPVSSTDRVKNVPPVKVVLLLVISFIGLLIGLVLRVERREAHEHDTLKQLIDDCRRSDAEAHH